MDYQNLYLSFHISRIRCVNAFKFRLWGCSCTYMFTKSSTNFPESEYPWMFDPQLSLLSITYEWKLLDFTWHFSQMTCLKLKSRSINLMDTAKICDSASLQIRPLPQISPPKKFSQPDRLTNRPKNSPWLSPFSDTPLKKRIRNKIGPARIFMVVC